MCAKYIKFVFQNNFLYLFLSRKGKPLGGPSSFCLSAHASCPYAPHDRSPPEFCRNSCGRRASEGQDWPGAVPPLGWVARPLSQALSAGKGRWEKGLLEAGQTGSTPRLQKVNEQANKIPRQPPKAAKTYRVLRTKGGPWEWGAHKGDAVPRWGITAFLLHVPAQPVTVCSFTYLRLLLIVYTALCLCRVNVCSSHQSLPATYRVVWPRNVTNLWLLKAEWWGYGVRRSKDRRGSCFPYLTETYSF